MKTLLRRGWWAVLAAAWSTLPLPARAGPPQPELERWTSPVFCRIAPWAGVAGLEAAAESYRLNRNREAAAQFDAVRRQDGHAATRAAAALGQARALKVMACDDEAMAVLRGALAGPTAAHCLALSRLARLTVTRQLDDADRMAEQALLCATRTGAPGTASEALTTRAIIALARGACAAARTQLRDALDGTAQALARAEALRTLGQWHEACERDVEAARGAYLASARAAEAARDPEALALARILRSLAQPAAAPESAPWTEELQAAYALASAGEMRRAIGSALHYHALRLARAESGVALGEAASELEASAAIHAAIGHRSQERLIRLEAGNAYLALGDHAGARAAFIRSRELALASGLQREAAKALQGLAAIARFADPPEFGAARELMRQALAEFRGGAQAPSDMARALHELATIEAALGEHAAAAAHFREGLRHAAQGRDRAAAAALQASLGWVEWRAGRFAAANAAWRIAVAGDSRQAYAIGWWGLARAVRTRFPSVAAGRYARVIDAVERMRPAGVDDKAQEVFDRRFSEAYREYAALLIDLERYEQAHQMAMLMNRRELIELRWTSGTRGGQADSAIAMPAAPEPLEQCPKEVAEQERDLFQRAEKLAGWRIAAPASCCREDGGVESDAECGGDPALAGYCQWRRGVWRAERDLMRLQNDCIEAISRATSAGGDSHFPLRKDEFGAQWSRAVGDAALYLVVTIFDQGRLRVLVRGPSEGSYRARSAPVTVEQLSRMTAALRDAWELAARQMRGGEGRARDDALAAAEARLRQGVLRELYTLLFAGFDPAALPRAPRPRSMVAFINDPLLRNVPMAALHDGQHYLGERFAIVQVTRQSVVAPPSAGKAVDSLVMGISKPDLPNVESEVREVARVLGTDGFLNEQSTRRRLLAWLRDRPRSGLALHLASHGWMGGSSASARIKLWDGEFFSGADWAGQRAQWRQLRLVVFSACASAVSGGDMELGLAGVAEQGAASVLGSLWNVDDGSTGRLMAVFYENWRRQPEAGVADALAQAQRALMRERAHPYFWAPFILVGRWD